MTGFTTLPWKLTARMSDITDSVDDLGEEAPFKIKEILEGDYLPAKPKKAGRPVGSTKDQAFSKRGAGQRHEPNDVQRQTVMMHVLLGTPKNRSLSCWVSPFLP